MVGRFEVTYGRQLGAIIPFPEAYRNPLEQAVVVKMYEKTNHGITFGKQSSEWYY